MKPRATSVDGLLKLRYELPSHVNAAFLYPIPASNGSRVVVCGHNQGVSILWRGGKPLKPSSKLEKSPPKPKKSNSSAIVLIDSDDEQPSPPKPKTTLPAEPEFEDEEEEFDSRRPYLPIIQHLDLPLRTTVLHISCPGIPSRDDTDFQYLPNLLQEKLVVALVCADCTVRLLILPLDPPSQLLKARARLADNISNAFPGCGFWGEELITLGGSNTHRMLPKGICLALAPQIVQESTEEDGEENIRPSSRPSRKGSSPSKGLSASTEIRGSAQWDLLIASHSQDVSRLLLIHRVPISKDKPTVDISSNDHDLVWRAEYLHGAAVSVQLYVPSQSSEKPIPRVLVAEASGPVRMFDTYTESDPDRGSWRLTLYPNMETAQNGVTTSRTLIDAKWLLAGKAIVITFSDGEWGIWHLGQKSTIYGGMLTKFTINGWISDSLEATNNSKKTTGRFQSKLAPMTPGTRKVKQSTLFSETTSAPRSKVASTSGGIVICHRGRSSSGKAQDELVAIWHGNRMMTIPSIQGYWHTRVEGGGSLFASDASSQTRSFNNAGLPGDLGRCIALGLAGKSGSKQPEVFVASGGSLTILTQPLVEEKVLPVAVRDQQLLKRGELGIDGMERIFSSMPDEPSDAMNGIVLSTRREGFGASR
ncbi:MAG: hypothetical protein MMC33_006204 [Icmadophila ericetorum]|nr:hypothetical protein [Icmadophila ericetorum]